MFWNGSAGNRTPVQVTDFQVLDTGPRIGETWNCVRTTVAPQDLIFADGFD
jgi:serine/threonine-protein kinase